ncbi:MAG TPA: S1 family peptidase [Actinophytocola sp.]|uniref:S1 family peptidase n=1 Tax=Actinophytocola sp. TaxID=1872138 RepID=UPI002E01F8DE|nr:S1 family peptidase [Actinophytocola sp.]
MLIKLIAVCGTAALTVTLAASPASGADDKAAPEGHITITDPVPGGFGSWDELFTLQNKLNTAAGLITSARATGPDDGYAGITAAPQNRRLDVFWHGPVPPKVAQAITDARRDVPVTLAPARYSERELLDEAARIVPGRGVSDVSPVVDGTGLTVSVTGSASDGRQIPEIRAAKVPVTIEPFTTIEPQFNRQADTPPYYGGARYSVGCSTGFAVQQQGESRMLSAGHCANEGQTVADGNGQTMGKITLKNPIRDTLFIRATSAARVYVNGVFSGDSIPVRGVSANYVGNVVCTSGAATGTHCPIVVLATKVSTKTESGIFEPMVKAKHLFGGVASGKGDSGGPVFDFWDKDGHQSATAKGTISAGADSVGPCELSSKCGKTVYYADIVDTMLWYWMIGIPTFVITA